MLGGREAEPWEWSEAWIIPSFTDASGTSNGDPPWQFASLANFRSRKQLHFLGKMIKLIELNDGHQWQTQNAGNGQY
ncbi:MAG: hypothetical protein COS85_17695 [Armatimonadetes bacterium CG07_land_8_20_14_0_80_59_28]|nr:MAG: hypothetical protein COS85_17695 [Armatimonadetes bacterium CG07_land_8_20_14_0_80_59_28]